MFEEKIVIDGFRIKMMKLSTTVRRCIQSDDQKNGITEKTIK